MFSCIKQLIIMASKIIKETFTVSCWLTVGVMIGYWFYKYEFEDRDIGIVDYVPLEDANDIELPIATICLLDPFLDSKLKETDPTINSTIYVDYLAGTTFREELHRIDYDKVTLNISHYFENAAEVWNPEFDVNRSGLLRSQQDYLFSGFISRAKHMKCFSLKVDFPDNRNIQEIELSFDRQRLLSDWKNSLNQESEFCLKPHYPGQFFLGPKPQCWPWMLVKDLKNIRIKIEELEIIRRRNTRNKACEDNSNAYDKMVIKRHLYLHNCRHPSLSMFDSFPVCDSARKILESKMTYGRARSISVKKPCRRISTIRYTLPNNELIPYSGIIKNTIIGENTSFKIRMEYPDEIKTISQVKEVDIHSLIGNIGGYFGLFLGNGDITK